MYYVEGQLEFNQTQDRGWNWAEKSLPPNNTLELDFHLWRTKADNFSLSRFSSLLPLTIVSFCRGSIFVSTFRPWKCILLKILTTRHFINVNEINDCGDNDRSNDERRQDHFDYFWLLVCMQHHCNIFYVIPRNMILTTKSHSISRFPAAFRQLLSCANYEERKTYRIKQENISSQEFIFVFTKRIWMVHFHKYQPSSKLASGR